MTFGPNDPRSDRELVAKLKALSAEITSVGQDYITTECPAEHWARAGELISEWSLARTKKALDVEFNVLHGGTFRWS